MNRRSFLASTGLGLGALAFRSRQPAATRVNGRRLNEKLAELSRFGRTSEGGISRVAYSDADREGRSFTMEWMREAGLDVRIDTAGNILGRRAGSSAHLPPLMLGSHIDSVPRGGNYDGQVGAMGAIEVAHTLEEARLLTRHALEIVIFQNEENGKTGSRAMAGELTARDLELPSHTERTVGEGIAFIGGDPERIDEARRARGDIAAFFELHVEQGAILDESGIDIGVVEGIVGIERYLVTVEGFANHAGTTPMDQRRDAMLTAGRFIDLVNRVVTSTPGRQVGTVGKLEAHPGAPNVIPGRVELTLEIRDLSMEHIEAVFATIAKEAEDLAATNGTSIGFERYYVSRAALTDERLQNLVARTADELGLSYLAMPSGAGHDAQSIALLAPVGMIFVPSVLGVSHSPEELTRPADIENGANVLLLTVLAADRRDWV